MYSFLIKAWVKRNDDGFVEAAENAINQLSQTPEETAEEPYHAQNLDLLANLEDVEGSGVVHCNPPGICPIVDFRSQDSNDIHLPRPPSTNRRLFQRTSWKTNIPMTCWA
jgi:hypothetical protein